MKSESIKYSLEALRKRKSRSLLTIISIFIGIATIFIFISFGMGLYNYVNSFVSGGSANKILIEPKGIGAPGLDSTFSLTSNDLTAVQRTAGVYSATGIYDGSAQVQFKNNLRYVIIVGYDPQNPASASAAARGAGMSIRRKKPDGTGFRRRLQSRPKPCGPGPRRRPGGRRPASARPRGTRRPRK